MSIDKSECPDRYNGYLSLVPEGHFLDTINLIMKETLSLFKSVSEEESSFKYAEGKWSIKKMLGHLIDTERIIGYWILRTSRGDKTDAPNYNDNEYMENSNYDSVKMKDLIREYRTLKVANIIMLESLTQEQLLMTGYVNNDSYTTRSFINILIGHEQHHINVLKERYFPKLNKK